MKKVKFAVIGLGGMGNTHIEILKSLPNVELMALCDVKKDVVEEKARELKILAYTDYKKLLKEKIVDAITIATPHYFHPPIAIKAMEIGIHVLCEKPVAVSVSEADKMAKKAEETNIKYAVMYQRRTEAVYQKAKEMIDCGLLGEIYRTCIIATGYRTQAYYNSGLWRGTWKGEGGGVLINQAPHDLDMFIWLCGMPKSITAITKVQKHNIEVEDFAHALIEYKNGALGYLAVSTVEVPGTHSYEICGEKGKMIISGKKIKFAKVEPPVIEHCKTSTEAWDSPKIEWEDVPVEQKVEGHKVIMENFIASILNGEKLIAPGQEGIYSVELINAIILSSKKGKKVDLPLDRNEYDKLLKKLIKYG